MSVCMNIDPIAWGVALAACVPRLAAAQAARTEPPKATPQLTYRSAFADYAPYKDQPLANWRLLNNTVAGVPGVAGGHGGNQHHMDSMNGSMNGSMKGMDMPRAPAAPASAAAPSKSRPLHGGPPAKAGPP